MYDYIEAMKQDIIDYLNDTYDREELDEKLTDRDEFAMELYDDLWTVDSVTGNGSGSYTFNSAKAHEYVNDAGSYLQDAIEQFCIEASEVGKHFINEDWEYFDVTVRCYLLGDAIREALDEIEEERSI